MRSLDEDSQGRRFEVRLHGDLNDALDEGNFIFAHGDQPAMEPLGLLGVAMDRLWSGRVGGKVKEPSRLTGLLLT